MTILQGFSYHAAYLDRQQQLHLWAAVRAVVAEAPFYTPTMPRSGKPLSVRMTNCGSLGWMTDRTGGYRYQATHPITNLPWPAIPEQLLSIWRDVTDCQVLPEACLVNHYAPGSRLGSHVDADEADTTAPVVSISLGDDAVFHVGGLRRSDAKHRITLHSGDVVVLGGASRLAYHGVDRILPGTSDLIEGGGRINLTMRRVTLPA
ncbi:MAG: alpha-ketoglutarate-dependent dioxygenase AlkB [Hyphomicrobiaceae bacterium]